MYQEIHPMRANTFDYLNASREEWQDENYVYEIKYDGERQIIHILEDRNYMTGRRVSDVTGRLPEKGQYVPHITGFDIPSLYGTVIDGELIHPTDFDILRSIMGSGTAERAIRLQEEHGKLHYYVYDLLYYKGEDVTKKPFSERRKLLEEVVIELYQNNVSMEFLKIAKQFNPKEYDIQLLFEQIIEAGHEGLMRRRLSGKYKICDGSKKSSDLQKLKKIMTFDGIVTGYEYGKGKYNKDKVAKLVFSQYKDGELVERCSFDGFTKATIEDMSANIEKYLGRVVEVKCNEVLKSGKLRHPKFNRWRDDKDPKQCVWENE